MLFHAHAQGGQRIGGVHDAALQGVILVNRHRNGGQDPNDEQDDGQFNQRKTRYGAIFVHMSSANLEMGHNKIDETRFKF